MSDTRSRAIVASMISVCVLIALAAGWQAWIASSRAAEVAREIRSIELEADALLDEEQALAIVLSAPLVTWADMVAGLHEAASRSRLGRFAYSAGEVVPLADPRAPLESVEPEEGDDDSDSWSEDDEQPVEPEDLPYRALTATVHGSGPYASIVEFTGALSRVTPAMSLEQLVIRSDEPTPSFEARVRLVTALPIPLEPIAGDAVREDAGPDRPTEATR
ncbi:MAG: hypothetical protein GY716_09205 [bacterium]|nr:hypothetical protein [bacterium]